MRQFLPVFMLLPFLSCQGQGDKEQTTAPAKATTSPVTKTSKIERYYRENKGNDQPSKSTGTVSEGALENGKLIPFQGVNFQYFDTLSYLNHRAYLNDKLKATLLGVYKEFEITAPDRKFFIMECSNKDGGQIFPHRTHQNGLSVDFMTPKKKDRKDYYGLDTLGKDHYWLDFDDEGRYLKDRSVSIDFDLVASHILLLNDQAKVNGLKISKVIIKTELKDELFATANGRKLKDSGIYIVKALTPFINSLHDDHYHIDFEILK